MRLQISNPIESFFVWCVELMRFLAAISGMTYKEINVYVFLVLQPALIILFFVLWRIEVARAKNMKISTISSEPD